MNLICITTLIYYLQIIDVSEAAASFFGMTAPDWTSARGALICRRYDSTGRRPHLCSQHGTRPQDISDHPMCRGCVGSCGKSVVQQIWSLFRYETSHHHQESVAPSEG